MPDPKFSVVIPLFNKREYVQRCVKSVIAQDYQPSEIIVVDDGSTDGGADHLIASVQDERLTIITQANLGPGIARNTGAWASKADWVALLDADDFWAQNHLTNLRNAVKLHPEVDIVGSGFEVVRPDAMPAKANHSFSKAQAYKFDYICSPSDQPTYCSSAVAIRRIAFVESGGFLAGFRGEDVEFWTRFSLIHQGALTPAVTAFYCQVPNSLMRNWTGQHHELGREPQLITLENALANGRLAYRHRDLAKLRDRILFERARQGLALGKGQHTRQYISMMSPECQARSKGLLAFSLLPNNVMRLAFRVRRAIKQSFEWYLK